MILLVDMDSFFAQVEQRNNPALRGRPVLVGGNAELRHGVVAAASYEAKRCGVKSGMSYFEAKRLCPEAITVYGNTDKYVDCCYELLAIFREFTDMVECYSIDEAFLDVSHVARTGGTAEKIARGIKKRVWDALGLTCTVGIGPNKLVAKMACGWEKPDGLAAVHPEELPHIIWPLPVDEIWGIGPRLTKRLNRIGVETIGGLARVPAEVLKGKFGVYGLMMHRWAHGIDDTPVDPSSHMTVKSMGHSYTLPADTEDREEIRWYLFWLSDRVARRLRKDNYRGRAISVVVRTADFRGFSRDRTIPRHTDSPQEICGVAEELLWRHHAGGPVRLLGVKVGSLRQDNPRQLSLDPRDRRSERSLRALDVVKDKYGPDAITFASIMDSRRRTHQKIGVFLTNREKGNRRSPLMPPGAGPGS